MAALSVGDLELEFLFCDSLGAKTACVRVETPDTSLTIDPGVAVMQASYPLPRELKRAYERRAAEAIRPAVTSSEHLSVSHYHHDHYPSDPEILAGTDAELWVKDPNRWINDSQRERGQRFVAALAEARGEEPEHVDPRQESFPDPLEDLDHARERDFGDYQDRHEELVAKWRSSYEDRVETWRTEPWIAEPEALRYADGDGFEVGDTRIRFLGPWFHGIEYSPTGFVFATLVETSQATFVHSSDLQGPVIEDYADRVIDLDPDALFLDGPATYLLGTMLNRTYMQRSIDNAVRVFREVDPDVGVFDHHPLRERKYRERTSDVWDLADEGYNVTTVAGLRGEAPIVDRAQDWSQEELDERIEQAEAEEG